METTLKPVNNRLDKLEESLAKMGEKLAKVERTTALTYNIACVAGTTIDLQTVLFLDGTDPTVGETVLPALKSFNDIRNLTQAQLTRYYTGYFGRAPPSPLVCNMEELRRAVATAVGCMART